MQMKMSGHFVFSGQLASSVWLRFNDGANNNTVIEQNAVIEQYAWRTVKWQFPVFCKIAVAKSSDIWTQQGN